jgi:hypothetical protein
MTKPVIEVTLEPTVNNILRYLLCAPSVEGEPETGLLNLNVRIKNISGKDLRFNRIVIFVEGDHGNDPLDVPVLLPAERRPLGDTHHLDWQSPDYMFRPGGNLRLYLKIYSTDDDQPHEQILNIQPHAPFSRGYHFWGKTGDLEEKEFWTVNGYEHENTDSQMFAYDVEVAVARNGSYTERKNDSHGVLLDGKQNEDYRIWGKPIYAISGGVVRHCRNDYVTNERPLQGAEKFEDVFPETWADIIKPGGDGNGNFFTISNGPETILYAHMQPGTLNEEFIHTYQSQGIVLVQTGDFLGLAGNSGNSSRPHMHIHANRTTVGDATSWKDWARPMNFRGACALKWSKIEENGRTGPWVKLNSRGMPTAECAVWPSDYKPLDLARTGGIVFGEHVTIDKLSMLIPTDIYAKLKSPDPPP